MRLFSNMTISNNTLYINENSTLDLASKFDTPLYVIDGDFVKRKCQEIKDNFKHKQIETEILYASKAFSSKAMCKLINEQGLSLDVVSGGELYTAIKSGFPMSKVYFHGNNKSITELTMAIDNDVHRIIVDSLDELKLLNHLCASRGKEIEILLRVNPGVEAHTHEYVQTAKDDSKFGISFESEDLKEVIFFCRNSEFVTLKGIHCHIGSQIHESSSFVKAAVIMIDFIEMLECKYKLNLSELNIGGGFGVYYSEEDVPLENFYFLKNLINTCYELITANKLSISKIMIEPGRALIANAGITLYHVGFSKKTLSGINYLFVNGGMADNPRPALYHAKYEACIANKMSDEHTMLYTIAGKCCESGDILIKNINLPLANTNDLIAVSSTGAYNYSMASNYNRLPKPAVVLIENGIADVIIRRETYDDLIRFDI